MPKTKTNPEVRFAGFTEDWIPSKLGDIGEVKMCKRIFNNQTSSNGDIPFYKIGTFGKRPDAFISKELYQEFRNKYPFPKKGDILISASGTLGRIVVYDGKPAYFQDSNIVWLNHNESKILNEFLYYIYGNITYESEGGTIQRLYNSIILNAKFSYPESQSEQKLISNFFENIDKLIAEHQQKHEKLKALKKAMLSKMFPQEGQTVPEIRFKGFSEEWEETTISNLGEVSTGYPFDSKLFNQDGEYLVITNGNIQNELTFVDESKGNRVDVDSSLAQFILNIDDVLVTMDGTVGRTAKVGKTKQILAQRVGRIKAYSEPEFLYQVLNTGAFFREMILLSTGGTIKHISLSDISNYNVFVPPSEDEKKFIGNYFKNLDELILNHEIQITKLQNIKKAFLAKMFI